MKIKLIVGFRRDQEHSIDANEAHKAYYLFLNPDKRGVFNNGLAIIGSQIQEIVPDYQGSMGWNSTHVLDNDDWNEIRAKGVDSKLRDILFKAKEIGTAPKIGQLEMPMSELMDGIPRIEARGGIKSIGDLL
jgi:hypothetical protein